MDTTVQDFLAESRFNKSADLSDIDGQQTFHVTYADFGYRNEPNPDEEHVLLFSGPMMASRFILVSKHEIAKSYGIRIIAIDRPGFGGTEAVEIGKRIDITREITVALLRSLNIKHVSIMSQSGGAVYAFDLLLHYPELLYPEHPYLAIGAPWTHPVHSHVMAMRITHMLPRSAIGSLDKLLSTFNSVQGVIGPALQFISGARPYSSSTELASTADGEAIKFETNVQGKLLAHFNDHGFAGIADEAIMLLRRADDTGNGWGSWGDYDKLLPQLSTALRSAGGKLTVRSFWAEKDAITGDAGTAGPSWLIQCLQMEAEDSDAAITHSSFVVLGADHDTVWDLRFGMSQHVFKEISGKDPVASNEGS